MFDYHMHSTVSFDGHSSAADMLQKAVSMGLREICFTDHLDYDPLASKDRFVFDTQIYNDTYLPLQHPELKIRLGMEFGMLPDNQETLKEDLLRRPFDFIIGSVHFFEDLDIYYPKFWENKTMDEAEQICLEQTLLCVRSHQDFDVLGHLTYPSKAGANPTHRPIIYDKYRDLVDEILKNLVKKGKGIEINTSGVDRCGVYLPDETYLRRFKELGGEIVTVGSDAHNAQRVGQYCKEACELVQSIFGYVCTFENRKPIFHKI
ncbi:MAG: histidinol-phosphatase HisJ family protein [Oscillospiraceae bacterium]|nr:histidinol-phosphatase HisJ family protein [Oscillospiraceae bacterium]